MGKTNHRFEFSNAYDKETANKAVQACTENYEKQLNNKDTIIESLTKDLQHQKQHHLKIDKIIEEDRTERLDLIRKLGDTLTENEKLKELLRECISVFDLSIPMECISYQCEKECKIDWKSFSYKDWEHYQMIELKKQIQEVLGE